MFDSENETSSTSTYMLYGTTKVGRSCMFDSENETYRASTYMLYETTKVGLGHVLLF
jgi:hypothetical protein